MATAHMASLIPNSVRELGNAGRERIFDAVAIPAVLHIAIFIHRNHAAIAASNLIGIALVDLAKHGVVHKVSIAGCGAAQICAAAGGVAVSGHDTGLLLSLPRVEEHGPHKARWGSPVRICRKDIAPAAGRRLARRGLPRESRRYRLSRRRRRGGRCRGEGRWIISRCTIRPRGILPEPDAQVFRAMGKPGVCAGGLQRSVKALRPQPPSSSACSWWFLDTLAWCPFRSLRNACQARVGRDA